MAFADPTNLELMLSDLQSQLQGMQKSGNIYSRFVAKERELHLLRQKYLECSKALIESQNRAEHLQSMMLERELKTRQKIEDHKNKEQLSLSKDTTIKVPSVRKLVEDGTANNSVWVWEGNGRTSSNISKENFQSDDVEPDGEILPSNKSAALITESIKTQVSEPCIISVATVQESKTAVHKKCNTTPRLETKGSEKDVPQRSSVSEDLLQKVMMQNMRLKKGVREIIETRGLTVDEYLERQEYIETIKQLRLERHSLRSRVSELEAYTSSSADTLLRECSQLARKVRGLEHAATIRQAIVDVYSTELNKLRQETTSSNGSPSKESPISASDTKLFMREVLENLAAMKVKCGEMESLYRDACTFSARLQTRVNELEEQNKLKSTSREAIVSLPSTGLSTDSDSVVYAEESNCECRRCQKSFADVELYLKHVEKCYNE